MMFMKNTQCRHWQQAKLMINHTDLNWKDYLCQSDCVWTAGQASMDTSAPPPPACYPAYRSFSGIKGLYPRNHRYAGIWLYPRNDGREKMRFLRHLPCLPGPLLSPLPSVRPHKTPIMDGTISRFQLRTHAHPRHADAPTVVTHVERVPWPAKTSHRNHRSGHHSSTVLTAYLYVTLRSTQSWSKTNTGIQ